MEEKSKPIFLNSENIYPWERPAEEGYISLLSLWEDMEGISTKNVKPIGFETLDEEIGQYHVRADAAKYLADVISKEMARGLNYDGRDKLTPKEHLLFSGNIVVYQKGIVPGTELEGYDLVRRGKIWTSTKPEKIFTETGGLKEVILGNNPLQNIERILAGYKHQEKKREERRSNANHETFQRGRMAGERDGPMYRSGPC